MLVEVNVDNLRKYRIKRGLTRHTLSKKAGLGKNAVFQIEEKTVKKCSLLRIKSLADVLGIDYKKLINKGEN